MKTVIMGYNSPKVQEKLKSVFQSKGVNDIVFKVCESKKSLKDCLKTDDVCGVFLTRTLGKEKWDLEDYVDIQDNTTANVVIAVSKKDLTNAELTYLYEHKVYNVLLFKDNVKPFDVVSLFLKGRTSKDARMHYNLMSLSEKVALDAPLSDSEVKDFEKALYDATYPGKSLGERYANIAKGLDIEKNVYLLDSFKDETKEDLAKTKEYYEILGLLNANGANIRYKVPTDVVDDDNNEEVDEDSDNNDTQGETEEVSNNMENPEDLSADEIEALENELLESETMENDDLSKDEAEPTINSDSEGSLEKEEAAEDDNSEPSDFAEYDEELIAEHRYQQELEEQQDIEDDPELQAALYAEMISTATTVNAEEELKRQQFFAQADSSPLELGKSGSINNDGVVVSDNEQTGYVPPNFEDDDSDEYGIAGVSDEQLDFVSQNISNSSITPPAQETNAFSAEDSKLADELTQDEEKDNGILSWLPHIICLAASLVVISLIIFVVISAKKDQSTADNRKSVYEIEPNKNEFTIQTGQDEDNKEAESAETTEVAENTPEAMSFSIEDKPKAPDDSITNGDPNKKDDKDKSIKQEVTDKTSNVVDTITDKTQTTKDNRNKDKATNTQNTSTATNTATNKTQDNNSNSNVTDANKATAYKDLDKKQESTAENYDYKVNDTATNYKSLTFKVGDQVDGLVVLNAINASTNKNYVVYTSDIDKMTIKSGEANVGDVDCQKKYLVGEEDGMMSFKIQS